MLQCREHVGTTSVARGSVWWKTNKIIKHVCTWISQHMLTAIRNTCILSTNTCILSVYSLKHVCTWISQRVFTAIRNTCILSTSTCILSVYSLNMFLHHSKPSLSLSLTQTGTHTHTHTHCKIVVSNKWKASCMLNSVVPSIISQTNTSGLHNIAFLPCILNTIKIAPHFHTSPFSC